MNCSLFSVGGNDIIAEPAIDPQEPITHLFDHIRKLADEGGKQFLVNTLRIIPGGFF